MQVRFLIGPAGSGKTWRCLSAIRAALRADPAGPPLLLLAPKQATFQLERQLLSDPELHGFTRLRILSLDRLAADLAAEAANDRAILTEEGRIMVLRALLARHAASLQVFHATARLPGFARQLSLTLRELQTHQSSPAQLRAKASQAAADPALARKLTDCAQLLDAYLEWLRAHRLQDADALLDEAAALLGLAPADHFRPAGLWLDGFAEMTPQELALLAVLIPRCEHATLAFCLPAPGSGTDGRFSPWTVVGRTCGLLEARLRATPGVEVIFETLPANPNQTRFAHQPVLARLERGWDNTPGPATPRPQPDAPMPTGKASEEDPSSPGPTAAPQTERSALTLFACSHPEAEAVLAAHEVLAHVRAGGRFRETAVLLRSLEGHQAAIQRVFRRYEIPFFLDRRESVSHHPAAELTRYAVRLAASGWRHEDWFGALKTGLFPVEPGEVDALENEALARGWEGTTWHHPLAPAEDPGVAALEPVRQRAVAPMLHFMRGLAPGPASRPTGVQLAEALQGLWSALHVPDQLQAWAESASATTGSERPAAVHRTVWDQMQAWAADLALAFAEDALPLREWLPVLEAGLAGLTVGVVPPALDQVLIGAVDRSRNPDLELVIVPGVNDTLFPLVPGHTGLFSETDRHDLELLGVRLGPDRRSLLAHERFYAYIAFTRARARLVISWSDRDLRDKPLAPSPLLDRLRALFPDHQPLRFEPGQDWRRAVHRVEVAPAYVASRQAASAAATPGLALPTDLLPEGPWRTDLDRLAAYQAPDTLSSAIAAQLYGAVIRTSVSALEQFAACPFRFFVTGGLRADERVEFAIDARERGSYQHEILARFHQDLVAEGRRWRDLTPAEARGRVRKIAAEVAAAYRDGLFAANPEARFAARGLALALEEFVEATVDWLANCQFDPVAVELGFGRQDDPLPPWCLDLGNGRRLELRGRIDRVDLAPGDQPDAPCVMVIDYKSSAKTLDPVRLEHGLQAQLPVYLAVLRHDPAALATALGATFRTLEPAGAFYVCLRAARQASPNRAQALDADPTVCREAYRHRGRFRADRLDRFDRRTAGRSSGQFAYRLLKNGGFNKRDTDPLAPEAFEAMLRRTEDRLRDAGERILAGDIRVDPFRIGKVVACDHCDLQAVCRVERWTHRYRVLTLPGTGAGAGAGGEDDA